MLKKVTFLLILFMSAGIVFGAVTEDNFGINLTKKDGTENTVILSVDVDLAGETPDFIGGFTLSVCHEAAEVSVSGCDAGLVCNNSSVDICAGDCCPGIACGADTPSQGYWFHNVAIFDGGVVCGAVTDMMTGWGIESGEGLELYEITYELADGVTNSTIRTCNKELGDPPQDLVVVYGTASLGFPEMAELTLGGAPPTCDPFAINIASTEDNIAVVTLDTDGPEGETANSVTGFSFGVEQDSADVSVASVEQGQAVVDALGGDDIAWWEATIIDEGVTVSAVLSFEPNGGAFKALPECTTGAEIATINYCQSAGAAVSANVSLTGDLVPVAGRPAVPIEIVNGVGEAVADVAVGAAAAVNVTEECAPTEIEFLRGDVNQDARRSISDAISIAMYIFDMGAAKDMIADCEDSADANDDGTIDIPDAVYLLQYLFTNGTAIPEPLAACGADPTDDDDLGCTAYTCP